MQVFNTLELSREKVVIECCLLVRLQIGEMIKD